MQKFALEFVLNTREITSDILKESLLEFGEDIEVICMPQDSTGRGNNFKVQMNTIDPTLVFDACAQIGRLKAVKIQES
jgi:hypothetical protein